MTENNIKYKILILPLLVVVLATTSCVNNNKSDLQLEVKKRPNIILIMADDQGWGDVGYNGHPYLKTPNLDSMAANGVQFNRFYAASAVCSPTRGSVMTGRHPLRYGICYANCGHIKSEEITLGEMLKDEGYTTGHFGKWHLGTLTRDTIDANRGGRPKNDIHYAPPWEHGFDKCFVTESKVPTWNPMITPPTSSGDVNSSLIEGEHFGTYYWTGPGEIETENLEGDDSRVIMDRAIPFIENAANNSQQFLSVIWFHTPHLPVIAGDEDRKIYSDLSENQQHYYAIVTAMDEQIGRLRSKLNELGIADNTMIFYTSDNGPEGRTVSGRKQGITNGLKGRKRSLYEGGIRVPGILEWPGYVKPGTKVNTPCFTSDYFPTIAEILGIDIKKYNRPFDGINILPLVLKESQERNESLIFKIEKQIAVMNGDYKIYSANDGASFELYNIQKDPAEAFNIALNESEKLNEMIAQWDAWKTTQQESAQGNDY